MPDSNSESRIRAIARAEAPPNANSPQLLTHMLEMIARGVRSNRGLQEAVGIDQRTVRYYLQAGIWLGFLVEADEPLLSAEGLGYVYGGESRHALYADAVERQPFIKALLERSRARIPTHDELAAAIRNADPSLAESTIGRRTSAVRGLMAPFFEREVERSVEGDTQLNLPLPQAPTVEVPVPLASVTGRAFSPDVYRYVLCFLLDHGELSLGHVRGLLDRAGASEIPLGSYVDLALSRRDAIHLDERLIATPGAVARRELASNTASIILSDAGWRDHMTELRRRIQDEEGPIRVGGRYRRWNQRLFGRAISGPRLESDLRRVLRDRSLASWPRTDAHRATLPKQVEGPFLQNWHEQGLLIALPPSLAQLWEGLSGVNRRLRNARHRTDAVGIPTIAYRPSATHGGLLHPGETLPRSVPDTRTLRQRLVSQAPYVTMTVALLLDHRTRKAAPSVTFERGGWYVRRNRRRLGSMLDVLDGFARSRGWLTARRPRSGLGSAVLISLLERLGVVVCVSGRAMLDDVFFQQLRHDEEAQVLHGHLAPLASEMHAYVDQLHAATKQEST